MVFYGLAFSFFLYIALFAPQTVHSQIMAQSHIPFWIKTTTKWWSQGQISDNDFVNSIQYLLQKQILQIPPPPNHSMPVNHQIPDWIKNSTGTWATGHEPDDEFTSGIQYLMQSGILTSTQNSQNNEPVATPSTGTTNDITNNNQVLSDSDLVAMSANKYADGNVNLGDGKYVTSGPQKGFIYLCHIPPTGQGALGTGPWIHGNTWNFLDKPPVSGSVSWP
ncbi:MAG TPA: hypothetical protein VEJ68_05490, partial [Candidatus Bathyarchaeia archaeon]|nr:hypothetical protein [Candidatus Bathyarchaeia archaeon]